MQPAIKNKKANPIWAILIGLIFVTCFVAWYLTYYMRLKYSLMIVNAFYGLILFELAWRDTYRFRQIDEERDKLFPAFRRLDVKYWNKLKFYPLALTLLPIRALIALGGFCISCLFMNVISIGHDMRKPFSGVRGKLREFTLQWWNWLIPLSAFMDVSYEIIHFDYSFYLGPDYVIPNKAPTVVANHQSWIDNMIVVISPLCPGMAAKIETQKVWILSLMIKYTQGIFITRGGNKEERDLQIQQIIERQQAVEDNPDWNPICIYPEGTQSNGSALLQFKRGAFVSMKAVSPMVLNYEWTSFSPTWDSMTFLGQAPLMYSYPGMYWCRVKILPPFLPNKYLLEKHKDKGKEDWEIFAWAVRDIMARVGQFEKNE